MSICFGKTPPKTKPLDALPVTETRRSDSTSSGESFGETVRDLRQHESGDPQRQVEKMTSSMPERVSNKCKLL